jgi:hypothetical protein
LGATIPSLENDKAIPLEFIRSAVHLPGKHSSNLARFRRTASVLIAQLTVCVVWRAGFCKFRQ